MGALMARNSQTPRASTPHVASLRTKERVLRLARQFSWVTDEPDHERARTELLEMGAVAIRALADTILEGSDDDAYQATVAIGALNTDNTEAVARLAAALVSESPRKGFIARALTSLGLPGYAATIAGLAHPLQDVQLACLNALTTGIGSRDRVAETIAAMSLSADESLAVKAAQALAVMGRRAAPHMTGAIRRRGAERGSWNGVLLDGMLHSMTTHAVDVPLACAHDQNSDTRLAAVSCLAGVPLSPNELERVAAIARCDESPQVKSEAIRVLALASEASAHAVALIADVFASEESSCESPESRTQMILALERMRSRVQRSGTLSGIVGTRTRITHSPASRKRLVAESERSILALLDACVEWPEVTVSERRLCRSSLLTDKRRLHGLAGPAVLSSVHNHMKVLARLCGLRSLILVAPKRQSARFVQSARESLNRVRPFIYATIVALEKAASAEGSETRLRPGR